MIEITVNDRLGKKVRVKCNEDDTVGDLKLVIAAKTGTRAEKIVLKKWYTIYKDHITLQDYEIRDASHATDQDIEDEQKMRKCGSGSCCKKQVTKNSSPVADTSASFLDRIESGSLREYGLEEKCGVFGCISNGDWPTGLDVAQIISLGLVGLQHRGQESAGIVACKYKNEPFLIARGEGLVSAAFTEMSMMGLKGNLGVGHTRYSTSGGSGNLQLAQPFVVHTSYGTIAVSHNGELVNSSNLRQTLLSNGVGLSTGGDSELITQCLSQAPPDEFRHPKVRKIRNRNKASKQAAMTDSMISNSNGDAMVRSGVNAKPRSNSDASIEREIDNFSKRTPLWKADLTEEEDEITSRVLHLMSITPISYSLIIMYNECLYAVRDSFGNRPLTIGMLVPPPNAADIGSIPFSVIDNTFIEGWVISSESCPFPSIHAKLKRDVEPGEIVKFGRNKLPKTLAIMPRPESSPSPAFCIFEYVYFARPDSIVEKQTIYAVRMRCGRRLAIESPSFKDPEFKGEYIVAPVPESSIPAALGFSLESGLPYVEVFCKNRYVGRTFIQPSTRLRRLGVAKKFGPLTENFRGKSIILIDDSIVRGTTIGQLVLLLREAGAKEVHIRIASPPLHFPCYMGINIPTKDELIANHMSPDQLALALGASSLRYLSLDGLKESVRSGIINHMVQERTYMQQRMAINGHEPSCKDISETEIEENVGHCTACLTGQYPVPLDDF